MSDAPIDEYDHMTVAEVETAVGPYTNGIEDISDSDVVERLDLLNALYEYELDNKDRKTAKGHIDVVREQIREEAEDRGLTDDVSTAGGESEEEVDEPEEDDGDDGDGEDADGGAEGEEDEDEASDAEQEEVDPDPSRASFTGQQGNERILVRNSERTSKNIDGNQFHAGEVKDLVVNDVIKAAIRRGDLQVVKG